MKPQKSASARCPNIPMNIPLKILHTDNLNIPPATNQRLSKTKENLPLERRQSRRRRMLMRNLEVTQIQRALCGSTSTVPQQVQSLSSTHVTFNPKCLCLYTRATIFETIATTFNFWSNNQSFSIQTPLRLTIDN